MASKNDKTLRTKKTQERYIDFLENEYDGKCIFCNRNSLIKEFDFFVLLENTFPYDKCFVNHRLLAPKRHIIHRSQMYRAEQAELELILQKLDYDQIIINKMHKRSVSYHWHLHLVDIK